MQKDREPGEEEGKCREGQKRGRPYGQFIVPVGGGSQSSRGQLNRRAIELVTCVPQTKQKAEETNEVFICAAKWRCSFEPMSQ